LIDLLIQYLVFDDGGTEPFFITMKNMETDGCDI